MTEIAQHSSKSVEHYTPECVYEPARALMGGITLDPASCEEANKRIRALHFIGLPADGLACSWNAFGEPSRVFLNPPGGTLELCQGSWVPTVQYANGLWGPPKGRGACSAAAVWWGKLVNEWLTGNVEQAVFVGFTLEILRSTQDADLCALPVQAFPRCYPAKRLRFGGLPSPTHANVIAYLPPLELWQRKVPAIPTLRHAMWLTKLEEHFLSLGFCEGSGL